MRRPGPKRTYPTGARDTARRNVCRFSKTAPTINPIDKLTLRHSKASRLRPKLRRLEEERPLFRLLRGPRGCRRNTKFFACVAPRFARCLTSDVRAVSSSTLMCGCAETGIQRAQTNRRGECGTCTTRRREPQLRRTCSPCSSDRLQSVRHTFSVTAATQAPAPEGLVSVANNSRRGDALRSAYNNGARSFSNAPVGGMGRRVGMSPSGEESNVEPTESFTSEA